MTSFCRMGSSCLLLSLAASTLTAAGCATLNTDPSRAVAPGSGKSSARQTPAPDTPHYTVEIRSEGVKPQKIHVQLGKQDSVQTAVNRVKASVQFRRMDIAVVRPDPNSEGKVQTMRSKYNSAKRRVELSHDYALHAGDRVLIVENTSTVLDDMFDGIPNPFRRTASRRK